MGKSLGSWAVIDIETNGVDPTNDSIIDVGYLQFSGTKLVKKYSSLVQFPMSPIHHDNLSFFIQKLTGIDAEMLQRAPQWNLVKLEVQELYGHLLVAHNAKFEEAFLAPYFAEIADGGKREEFADSMFYLALLFPQFATLNLERFIVDLKLAENEQHRGLQDSLDLLKVMLLATALVKTDRENFLTLKQMFLTHQLQDYWFYKFFCLSKSELDEIAGQIDFPLDLALEQYTQSLQEKTETENLTKSFDLSFSGQNIKSILEDAEKVKEYIPYYQKRTSQIDLALKVGQSFKNNIHSLIQAPTGTGKTLGYLLPAALYTLNHDEQVLISTGTKALQQQAMTKDIPQLRKLLGLGKEELNITQLVGSSNHLCELSFRQEVEERDLFTDDKFADQFTRMYLENVFYYNSRVAYHRQIIRNDLPFALKMNFSEFKKMDESIAVDFRACTGSRCPYKQNCSYIQGLREAKEANIIIGNHALMFSWPKGFPRPAHIVVDEAHKIEHETTNAFTAEASHEQLQGFSQALLHLQGVGSLFFLLAQTEAQTGDSSKQIEDIRREVLETQKMIEDHLQPLEDLLASYFKKLPRYTDIFWNEVAMVSAKSSDELGVAIYNHVASLKNIFQGLLEYLTPYWSLYDVNSFNEDNMIIAFTRLEKFMGLLQDLAHAIDLSLDESKEGSRSLKYHASRGYSIQTAPINVGKVLHDGLLQTSKSVVYTSATLGNAHGDRGSKGIEWSTGYIYLAAEKRFKAGYYLPAVYDYKKNTKVFLCDDQLPFYARDYVEQVMQPVSQLIKNIHGRSLLLFSAKSRFEVAREILLQEFAGKIPVFIQGMGNNVIDEYKQSANGILLGMETFGEGIDIPGNQLQFVFIDKVPDLRMDLVVQERRQFYEQNLGNEFTDYYLAHRTRSLQQKLGRLLRTEKDYGGVIIVDSRVKKWQGRTLDNLYKLMEPYEINRASLANACHEVESFIEAGMH